MLFAFCISIFGFVFAHRTFTHFIERNMFDRATMTKIGTAYFVSVMCALVIVPTSRFSFWCCVFVPLIIAAISLSACVSRRTRNFQTDTLAILSVLILKMKSGRSFRQSLIEASAESEPRVRAQLSEIASVVAFTQQENRTQTDPFVRELIEEFRLIDQQPHASLCRLSVFREKIRIEDDFRRRSGQVLSRLRAQSLVMCGLYVAVFVFMTTKFGFRDNANALLMSILSFSIGSMWMWLGGRRLKWKV